jgi:hypothetical protein
MIGRLPQMILLFAVVCATHLARGADAPVEVVIAYEQGVQITAPQEWLQQFTRLGVDNVQIRSQRRGDSPQLESIGSPERPRYRLVGVLDSRNRLQFPGKQFTARDTARLSDYLKNVAGDGAEGVLAPRGQFGLTEKQYAAVRANLDVAVDFATVDESLADVLNRFDAALELPLVIDPGAGEVIAGSELACDDVSQLTRGTALALLLEQRGLALMPIKQRGEEVELRIIKPGENSVESWPVGWAIEGNQRTAAPKMFEFLTFEVAEHTLAQTVDALAPRIGMPIFWNHAKLANEGIDPQTIKVKLARSKSYHKRILDRLLFQARLKGDIRIDEAGTVFYWISR